jgi:ZIP family zinc transporter
MNGVLIVVLGLCITFFATLLGSGVVFFFKKEIGEKVNACIMGTASGIMTATSIFGLIMPAIEKSEYLGNLSFLPASVGIVLGALFLVVLDKIIMLINSKNNRKANLQKSTKLFIAVAIHNIPQGLAVGLAFGSAILMSELSAQISALSLALGIAIQNFPEGVAVSMPIKKETGSSKKAFLFGFLSGAVEPLFAIVGILLATSLEGLIPWFMAFSAGAMMFVIVEDLIPDAKCSSCHIGSWGFLVGFVVMMILNLVL